MAKKTWKKVADTLGDFVVGEASGMVGSVGKRVDRTLKDAEKKIEHATVNAIKASIVFIMMFIGLIFILVGLANYITERFTLGDGMGLIIVGAALIFLGWFARLVRP